MKRLKLNLDQLGKELEMLDNEHLCSIKGGWDGGYGAYGGYNSWEELWEAMQNGYVPPEGDYNPGGYSGYGDYGWGDYGSYGGYNGGWPGWFPPGSGGYFGGYGGYGGDGIGGYSGYGSYGSYGPDYDNSEVRISGGSVTNHGNGILYKGDDGRIVYFEGVNVATNSFDHNSAYQLNGNIYIGEDWRANGFDVYILAHEYGHYLQQQQYGSDTYYVNVALPSFISAAFNPENHHAQWYEENATHRGEQYLEEYSVYP
ncbi:hypothetical protein [Sphingobacterium arenae]|uniref:Peptidase M10 metallopeptidase domain-containing protein n=1 Tax=Sphingobacterium arenae TaxID=1280598 RepID=A0ABR7XZF9_9SPHI|nr:hypothetical protein [Sphingobacterium arenae]MBD1424446.1 hypothetical protein [Sphingobacterium arenae]